MSSHVLRMLESFEDASTLTLALSIGIVLITLVIFWLLKKRQPSKNNVLLLGTSNSGKTRIFCQLVYKTNLLTQISITSNTGVATIEKTQKAKEKSIELVDIPGQDKIRRKFFNMFKKSAKAIIFVVDSLSFHRESKDVAQFLFEVLTDDVLARSKLKLLIVCNKQEPQFIIKNRCRRICCILQHKSARGLVKCVAGRNLVSANCRGLFDRGLFSICLQNEPRFDIELSKGQQFIKTNLEKEIELLRKISSSALKSTNNDSKASIDDLFKNNERQFEFSDLKYFKVDFCETSSLESKELSPLKDWMSLNL